MYYCSSEAESSPASVVDNVKKNTESVQTNEPKKRGRKRKVDNDSKDENKEPKAAKVQKQTKSSGKNVQKTVDSDESDSDESSVTNSESQDSEDIPKLKKKGAKNVSDKNSKSNVRTPQKSKSLVNGAKSTTPLRSTDSPGSGRKRKGNDSKDSTPVKKAKAT